MKLFFTLFLSLFLINGVQAQNGIVRGRVYNAQTNASVEGAKVKSAFDAMQLLGSNLKASAEKLGIIIQ